MTAERDPRIEAVAKLLFTGPLGGFSGGDWENRRMCESIAEDVLREIDEAAANEVPSTCTYCGEPLADCYCEPALLTLARAQEKRAADRADEMVMRHLRRNEEPTE